MKHLKYHLTAAALFCGVGLISVTGLPHRLGSAGSYVAETRLTGYGALFLLGLALIIGPLARLSPRWFGYLVAFRRAVGVWSAIGGCAHMLFAIAMATGSPYGRPWHHLFVRQLVGLTRMGPGLSGI